MSPSHLIYSRKWAISIVQQFLEKYARGTNFLAEMCGIERQEVVERLILTVRLSNQSEWEAMKRVIKLCNRERFRDYVHIPVHDRRKYLTIVKENAKNYLKRTYPDSPNPLDSF